MEGDVDSWGEGGTEEGASNGMSGRQVCVCVCASLGHGLPAPATWPPRLWPASPSSFMV